MSLPIGALGGLMVSVPNKVQVGAMASLTSQEVEQLESFGVRG